MSKTTAKLYTVSGRPSVVFPDNAAPITGIRSVKVKNFPNYYKLTVFGDKNWSIRVKSSYDAAAFVRALQRGFSEYFIPTKEDPNVYAFNGTWEQHLVDEIGMLPIYADVEPEKQVKDFGSVKTTEENKGVNNMTNSINIINAAVTFDKELAFAVNGKYVSVDDKGTVKEVLPAFIIMKDVPALMPTVADKITAGSYYSANGNLYKALKDNKVIDLKTGIITEIAVASIPMTDKVIVYKPLFGAGKTSMKDILKAQMLAKAGDGQNNPMMLMALMGDDDMDMKDVLLMQAMQGNGGNLDMNSMLPLMLLDKDGDKDDVMEMMMLSQMGANGGNANNLLPLMLMMKKDKKAEPTA